MRFAEIADLFVTVLDKTSFFWNFYVVGIIAIVGWLFSLSQRLDVRLKIVVSVGFLFFIGMNLLALTSTYQFLSAIAEEMKAAIGEAKLREDGLKMLIKDLSFDSRVWFAWGIHAVMDTAILYCIWSDGLWRKVRA